MTAAEAVFLALVLLVIAGLSAAVLAWLVELLE